jgi:hypothetical protein
MQIQQKLNNIRMKKIFIVLLFLLSSHVLSSQENNLIPKKKTQKGFASMDYLSIKMPNDEDGNPEINMGITGIHYNLWLNKSIYTGLGFYGSVHGKRGGMFTLGINAGVKTMLAEKLFLDAGFHLGGGGGASTPDGGGAFILPHVNLGYQFKKFSTTIGYSYINFFDKGNINNKQIRLGIQIPLSFEHAAFKERENYFNTEEVKKSTWNQFSKRVSVMMHVNSLSPYGDSQFSDGVSLKGKKIRLAGFEFDSYFTNNWFAFFKADGAFHGIKGGYMDLFLGAGYHFSMNKNRTNILAKFGIGAGGGGGAETGGGFLVYPDISIEQKLYNNVYFSINKGYLSSPNKNFTSSTLGFGIKYYVDHSGIKNSSNTLVSKTKFKGIEIIIGQEMYLDAKRMRQPTENLHQIGLQLNLFLTKNIYLAGHTSFANFGNAGAYAEGIVGIGYQTKPILNNKVNLYTQILAGASGGGGISTGQGLIVKPSIGLNYHLNDKLKIRTAIGKVKARGGALNSTSISIGLNYNLSFLTAN